MVDVGDNRNFNSSQLPTPSDYESDDDDELDDELDDNEGSEFRGILDDIASSTQFSGSRRTFLAPVSNQALPERGSSVQVQVTTVTSDMGPIDLEGRPTLNQMKVVPAFSEILELEYTPELGADTKNFLTMKTEDDIASILEDLQASLRSNFTLESVKERMKQLLVLIAQGNRTKKQFQDRLHTAYHDVQVLKERQTKDPRMMKLFRVAEMWRREKSEAVKQSEDTKAALRIMENDVVSLELHVNNMQRSNKRLAEQLRKALLCEATRDELEEKIVTRDQTIEELNEELSGVLEAMDDNDTKFKKEISQLNQKLESKNLMKEEVIQYLTTEVDSLKKLRERNAIIMNQMRDQAQTMSQKIISDQHHFKDFVKSVSSLKKQITGLKSRNSFLTHSKERLKKKNEGTIAELKREKVDKTSVLRQNEAFENKITQLKREAKDLNTTIRLREDTIEQCKRKIDFLNTAVKDKVSEINALEKSNTGLRSELHKERQLTRGCKHELTLSSKNIKQLHEVVFRAEQNVKHEGIQMSRLDEFLRQKDDNIERLRDNVGHCERSLRIEADHVDHLREINMHLTDDIQTRELEIHRLDLDVHALQKTLTTCKTAMQKLRDTNVTFTTERNAMREQMELVRKILDFTKNERETADNHFRSAERQITMLKESEQRKISDMLKLADEVSMHRLTISYLKSQLHSLWSVNETLEAGLLESEKEKEVLIRQNIHVIRQRDLFGTTIIRRKAEAALTEEKMRVLERLKQQADTAYMDRSKDCYILLHAVRDLRRKLKLYENTDIRLHNLKTVNTITTKELSLEKAKVSKLEKFIAPHPHPHRFLMEAQPSMFELVKKIQALQKLVINKCCKLAEKDSELLAAEKRLCEIKILLGRRDPVAGGVSSVYQKDIVIRQKTRQIKSLMGENNMLDSDMRRKDEEVKKLREEVATARQESLVLRQELTKLKAKAMTLKPSPPSSSVKPMARNSTRIRHSYGRIPGERKHNFKS